MTAPDLSLRDHALRVAVLDVISKETAAALKTARGDAEAAFAPAGAAGQSQQRVMLPDGTPVGLISIKAAETVAEVSGDALEAWVTEHLPDGMEEYADTSALTDPEVLDVLKAVFPHLVKRRIRPATRTALMEEISASGGWLADKETGEKEQVAEVRDLQPTGAFALNWRPSRAQARELVIAAWRRGELQGIALDALALPASGGSEP